MSSFGYHGEQRCGRRNGERRDVTPTAIAVLESGADMRRYGTLPSQGVENSAESIYRSFNINDHERNIQNHEALQR